MSQEIVINVSTFTFNFPNYVSDFMELDQNDEMNWVKQPSKHKRSYRNKRKGYFKAVRQFAFWLIAEF